MKITAPFKLIGPHDLTTDGGITSDAVGTYYDANGILRTRAGANVLRVTYDPTDLTKAPYALIEPAAATNVIKSSENLADTTVWSQIGLTVTPNTDLAPDGAWSMDTLNGVAAVTCYVVQTFAVTPQTDWGVSIFFKQGTSDSSWVRVFNNGTSAELAGAILQWANGVPSVIATSGVWTKNPTIESVGGGIYRLKGLVNAQANAALNLLVYPSTNNKAENAKFWGAHAQLGEVGAYIPTGAAPVTRAADVVNPVGAFVYSNLLENDYPAWDPAAAYVVGDRRVRNHHIYEAQQANTNKPPEANNTGTPPIWQDLGATNQRACLDQIVAAASSGSDRLIFVFRPGKFTSALALLNVDANDVRVSMVDENGVVRYQQTQYLRIKKRTFTDWFFKPVERKRSAVFEALPFYSKGLITVTVTKVGGTPSVGEIVTGRTYEIGSLQWKPEIRGLRFSKIATDPDFGLVTFLKRPDAKEITCDLVVDNDAVEESTRVLDVYTTSPVVFFAGVGSNKFGGLLTALGFVSDYRTVLDSTARSLINTKIQGFV